LSGAFQAKMIYGILGASGVIWGACYLLWMYQKVFYGPIHHNENKTLPDIDGREQISLWPVAVMALVMGVVSPYWMKTIDPAVAEIDKTFAGASAAGAKGPAHMGAETARLKSCPDTCFDESRQVSPPEKNISTAGGQK